MPNEMDIRRKFVAPNLQSAGWDHARHGSANEILREFCGADRPRNAVSQLQSLLYAA